MFQVSDRRSAGKVKLLGLLADLESVGTYRRTLYLKPDTLATVLGAGASWPGLLEPAEEVASAIGQMPASDTGVVVAWGEDRAAAIVPPFPVFADGIFDGAEFRPLIELLKKDLLIGVVLLRLGRYAVGVLRGEKLVASKTGSRYVKSRHRAGGSSQRRFERSRERLVRELFDKACEVSRGVFEPFEKGMDYLLLGGERHTLRGFVDRCRYLQRTDARKMQRVLETGRPGQAELERIAFQVWSSRVLTFERSHTA